MATVTAVARRFLTFEGRRISPGTSFACSPEQALLLKSRGEVSLSRQSAAQAAEHAQREPPNSASIVDQHAATSRELFDRVDAAPGRRASEPVEVETEEPGPPSDADAVKAPEDKPRTRRRVRRSEPDVQNADIAPDNADLEPEGQ